MTILKKSKKLTMFCCMFKTRIVMSRPHPINYKKSPADIYLRGIIINI